MSDRLAELKRQRDLLAQHVAWLDGEIAAEQTRREGAPANAAVEPPSPGATVPAPAPSAAVPRSPAAAPPADKSGPGGSRLDPETILAQYQTDHATVRDDVRRGCFLYFALALGIVLLGVVGFYLYTRSLH